MPKRAPEGINSKMESPIGDAVFLLALTAGLIVILFFALGVFTSLVVKKIDHRTETQFFQHTAEAKQTDQEKELQKIVDKLWGHFPESQGSKIHVKMLTSDHMNAFMSIGGNMQLTTELLDKVKYENELAFVVCHEIGHFYNRDVLNGMGRNLGLAFILSYLGFGDSMDLVSLSSESLALAFDRKQEQKADEFALDCMAKEYGHVQGHDKFFQWILKEETSIPRAGRQALSFMQSHPLTESRLEHLKQEIQSRKYKEHGKLSRLPFR